MKKKDTPAYKPGRQFLLRLPRGSDILEELTAFCARKGIRCASVQAIGATREVCLGYYDQARRQYRKKVFRGEMEILSCCGNVSLKDGKPFPHLHAAMGDTRLRVWGGHLFPGSKVFAAEVFVAELAGARLARVPDADTGLALWE